MLAEAFANRYEPPPDHTLLLLVASILFEPVDWVVTGVEVLGNLAEGDLGAAVVNIGLAILFTTLVDNVGNFRHAPNELPGGGALGGGGLNDMPNTGNRPIEFEFSDIGSGRRASSIEISGGSTIDIVINSQHAFDRPHTIPGTGGQTSAFSRTQLTQDQVENAILNDLSQQITQGIVLPVPNGINSSSSFYDGVIVLEGLDIGYHAVQTQDGKIRISTYYLTQAN